MWEYALNTSTNDFCQYCPRREVPRLGTVLRSICQASWPSPTTTLDKKRTSQATGIVFGELSVYFGQAMLEYLLNTLTTVFCYNCLRRLGLGSGAGAKHPESRPPAHWTGRGRVNEGIMFGELSILLLLFVRFLLGVCMGV